jgi:hypothetical protein
MENSRSRSPRRKHRSRKSHSRSRSKRDHRRSGSKDEKHKHKKPERVYESPFGISDIYFSSNLAGASLTRLIKKDYPKMIDLDEARGIKRKSTGNESALIFLDTQTEEACKNLLKKLENK